MNLVWTTTVETFSKHGLFSISASNADVSVKFCFSFHSPTPAALSPSDLLTFQTTRSASSSRDLPRSSRRSGCWRRRYDVLSNHCSLMLLGKVYLTWNSPGLQCYTKPSPGHSSVVCSTGGSKCWIVSLDHEICMQILMFSHFNRSVLVSKSWNGNM